MWRSSGKCGAKGYRGRQTGGFLTMFSLFHRHSDATADLRRRDSGQCRRRREDVERLREGRRHVRRRHGAHVERHRAGVERRQVRSRCRRRTATSVSARMRLADADAMSLTTTNGTIRAELPAVARGQLRPVCRQRNGPHRLAARITRAKVAPAAIFRARSGASTRVVKMRAVNGNGLAQSRRATAGDALGLGWHWHASAGYYFP